jgi:hypothetical protein
MTRAVILVAVLLLAAGCRVSGGRWVVEEPVPVRVCPGGVINQERRFVDTFVGGRVRNTVVRTDACLN